MERVGSWGSGFWASLHSLTFFARVKLYAKRSTCKVIHCNLGLNNNKNKIAIYCVSNMLNFTSDLIIYRLGLWFLPLPPNLKLP